VADDKLIHAYFEDMVRFYLGEEPLLSSVRTYDPGIREHRDEIFERIEDLVVKPRAGSGGHAQELVMLSPHPTVIDDRLEPRHVDLRPFVFGGDDGEVAPGARWRAAYRSWPSAGACR
jgi:uncharacterized circularly permuted ATP-grasp superfamily protein